jgi:hypothetical protein
MELCLQNSRSFYTLAIDIYKTLSLRRENRGEDGKDYLNKKYAHYIKIVEASNLLKRKLKADLLTDIPEQFLDLSPKASNIDEDTPILEPIYKLPRQSIHEGIIHQPLDSPDETIV